jgi:hypothetical protein
MTLDPHHINNKFETSKKIADIKTLTQAYYEVKNKKEILSEKELLTISQEISQGIFKFEPLKSYKVPKYVMKLNKAEVAKYLKNKSINEKKNFYKKMNKERRNSKICLEYGQLFEETLKNKVVAQAIYFVLENLIKNKKYYPENLFSFRKNYNCINIFKYLKTKINNIFLTFTYKTAIQDFIPNIQRKFLIKGLFNLVDKKDNKFYHLIKSYLNCGYQFFILKKSAKIGARTIKVLQKNQSKYFVYFGTTLAPIFSNIVNTLILKEINDKLKTDYYSNEKQMKNFLLSQLKNKKYNKIKSRIFINNYKKVWLICYHDKILLLGHLLTKDRNYL